MWEDCIHPVGECARKNETYRWRIPAAMGGEFSDGIGIVAAVAAGPISAIGAAVARVAGIFSGQRIQKC